MNEQDRCWCGSMFKDKPHNCIGTKGRVEGLLAEVRLLHEAIDKSNVALVEAIQTKEERDRLLLQIEEMKKWCCSACGLYVKNDPAFNKKFVEKRKCECVWLDGGIVGEYRDPKVPCPVHDKRIEPSQKCPRCPCPHDWNTVKSHTEHFDGPTICTQCGKEQN